jgi:hypothetical protein
MNKQTHLFQDVVDYRKSQHDRIEGKATSKSRTVNAAEEYPVRVQAHPSIQLRAICDTINDAVREANQFQEAHSYNEYHTGRQWESPAHKRKYRKMKAYIQHCKAQRNALAMPNAESDSDAYKSDIAIDQEELKEYDYAPPKPREKLMSAEQIEAGFAEMRKLI